MKKEAYALTLMILFLTSCGPVQEVEEKKTPHLGDLCGSTQECREFCQERFETCINHCDENPGNEFCITNFNMYEKEKRTKQTCKNVTFTEPFVNPTYVAAVSPIGTIHGSGTLLVGRSYIAIKKKYQKKIPIFAPTDMMLQGGSHHKLPKSKSPDFSLSFDAGCGISVAFDHLKEVIPEIKSLLPPLDNSTNTHQVTPYQVKAGDLIGYFIPHVDVAAFDFMVDSEQVNNVFPVQKRHEAGYGSNVVNSICPYDLYTESIKQEYYNLLGGGGGTLFKTKDCGSVFHNIEGTIIGTWFLDNTSNASQKVYKEGDYGNPLLIVSDEERTTIGHLGTRSVNWVYPENPTYKKPSDITQEHCYLWSPDFDTMEGYAFFKLMDNSTMKVAYSETGTCSSEFPKNSKTYVR